jgi:uncharacterized protein (DUF952 family)
MSAIVYKICSADAWARAIEAGAFAGAPADLQDGYIHLSSAGQVVATAAKHFAYQDNLLLIAVDAGRLGEDLKWERSRGGALFPHLYGSLELNAVLSAEPLPLGPDGAHVFPRGVSS